MLHSSGRLWRYAAITGCTFCPAPAAAAAAACSSHDSSATMAGASWQRTACTEASCRSTGGDGPCTPAHLQQYHHHRKQHAYEQPLYLTQARESAMGELPPCQTGIT